MHICQANMARRNNVWRQRWRESRRMCEVTIHFAIDANQLYSNTRMAIWGERSESIKPSPNVAIRLPIEDFSNANLSPLVALILHENLPSFILRLKYWTTFTAEGWIPRKSMVVKWIVNAIKSSHPDVYGGMKKFRFIWTCLLAYIQR